MFYLPVSTVTHTVKSVAQGRFQIAAKTEVALVWFWPRSYLVVVFICAHLPFFLVLFIIINFNPAHYCRAFKVPFSLRTQTFHQRKFSCVTLQYKPSPQTFFVSCGRLFDLILSSLSVVRLCVRIIRFYSALTLVTFSRSL